MGLIRAISQGIAGFEVISMLFGGACVIPIAIAATIYLFQFKGKKKIGNRLFWAGLLTIWIPIGLAIASELHWMLVEEPSQMQVD